MSYLRGLSSSVELRRVEGMPQVLVITNQLQNALFSLLAFDPIGIKPNFSWNKAKIVKNGLQKMKVSLDISFRRPFY